MAPKHNRLLTQLNTVNHLFDPVSIQKKFAIMHALSQQRLNSDKHLVRYMDMLLFTKTYPASSKLYRLAEKELTRIAHLMRSASKKVKAEYANSGLPYCTVNSRFSHDCIGQLLKDKNIDSQFDSFGEASLTLNDVLRLTLPSAEREITSAGMTNEELTDYLGIRKTEVLSFLYQQLENYSAVPFLKDFLFDGLHIRSDITGKNPVFSRAFNCVKTNQPVIINELVRRFDHEALLNSPVSMRAPLTPTEHKEWERVIRYAMTLTLRETDPATYMQPESLRIVELERGITVALYGIEAARQLPFESYVGYTLCRNGYPVAYGGSWIFGPRALFGINIFEPYRGGESGYILCQLLRVYKQLFGLQHIEAEPYQYGADNPDGIKSGAFWFYYKYGFRPLDKTLNRLAKSEAEKIASKKGYRSTEKTLLRFTEGNIARIERKGKFLAVADVTTAITHHINKKFKGDRKKAVRLAVQQFAILSGQDPAGLTSLQQVAFEEMALWAATMKTIDHRTATRLLECVLLKSIDQYEYQKALSSVLNQ